MEERKGILTPEQEKILDKVLVLNNKAAEALDGTAISLIDNQLIERLKIKLIDIHPDALEITYQMVDLIFAGIEQLTEE